MKRELFLDFIVFEQVRAHSAGCRQPFHIIFPHKYIRVLQSYPFRGTIGTTARGSGSTPGELNEVHEAPRGCLICESSALLRETTMPQFGASFSKSGVNPVASNHQSVARLFCYVGLIQAGRRIGKPSRRSLRMGSGVTN